MGTRIAVAVSIFAFVACTPEAEAPADGAPQGEAAAEASASFADEDAERVWRDMMATIAPDDGWDRARYLEFHWAVNRGEGEPAVREHRWDRWEGRAMVRSTGEDGPVVAIFDTSDPESGRVWVDGEELTGPEASGRLGSAYRAHINDAYWLLMPFKWNDPGVTARHVGRETAEDGREFDVVELTFDDDTGLTPQNMYRAFVNPETGLMERWHHYSTRDSDPSPSDWTGWRQVGPIRLAENRGTDGQVRIFFPHLRVETEVPEGAFDPPGSGG